MEISTIFVLKRFYNMKDINWTRSLLAGFSSIFENER